MQEQDLEFDATLEADHVRELVRIQAQLSQVGQRVEALDRHERVEGQVQVDELLRLLHTKREGLNCCIAAELIPSQAKVLEGLW